MTVCSAMHGKQAFLHGVRYSQKKDTAQNRVLKKIKMSYSTSLRLHECRGVAGSVKVALQLIIQFQKCDRKAGHIKGCHIVADHSPVNIDPLINLIHSNYIP